MREKLKIYLSLLMVFGSNVSFYSFGFSQNFHGGIIAGLNASQVDGDNYAGYNKLGFEVGFFVYRTVSEKVDLQLELKYMGKGARKKTTENDMTQYRSQLHYIEIPFILNYKAMPKLGLEGGLGFGYLFSYVEKDEYGALPEQDAVQFKPFELSGIGGLRYYIRLDISVHLRFSYSILPVLNHTHNITYHFNLGAYNNVLSIGVLYELGKNKI